jgi:hypothetical protein
MLILIKNIYLMNNYSQKDFPSFFVKSKVFLNLALNVSAIK